MTFSILPLVSNTYIPNLSALASYSQEDKTIEVFSGEQKISFNTNKDILKEALSGKGFSFGSDDFVEPSLDTPLNPGTTKVVIKKAMPVMVIDEGKVIIGKSAYLSAPDILRDLSINLYANDEVKVADPLEEVVLGLKIYIDRANVINLQVDSILREIHTRVSTVADLLYAENLSLNKNDRVEPSLETKLEDGMIVKVIRVIESESTELVDIPFGIQYKDDFNMFEGEKRVETQGELGRKEVNFKKVLENGQEIRREVLSEKILKEPKSQVVIRGRKPRFNYASGLFAEWINDAALKYGIDAAKMQRMMICESGGNPNSVGGGGRFYGLFQYLPSTWAGASAGAGYAGASIFDPKAQIYVTAWKISVSGYGAWPICGRR